MTRYKVRVAVGPTFDEGMGVLVDAESEEQAAELGLLAATREMPLPFEVRLHDVTAVS
ncbi:hypothetical protein LJR045_000991 [Microbacterium sp. LjRoot45]|uniref:hypothetical protein n=1 Tax=Microbacterium sp. LjRoot45 TaxID=3342329 RepID=UPI003ECE6C2C